MDFALNIIAYDKHNNKKSITIIPILKEAISKELLASDNLHYLLKNE